MLEEQQNNIDLPMPEPMRRQYTISTDKDFRDIRKKLCPEYGMVNGIEDNVIYWPDGHNFIDNVPRDELYMRPELYSRISRKMQLYINNKLLYAHEKEETIIFCELDNIFTEYNEAIEKITNKSINELSQTEIKTAIDQTSEFYKNLNISQEGKLFWYELKKLKTKYSNVAINRDPIKPIILIDNILIDDPKNATYREERIQWCRKYLGPQFNVIENINERALANPEINYYVMFTNLTTKHDHAIFNSVLISSSIQNNNFEFTKNMWETTEGLFCEYTKNRLYTILDEICIAFDI